MTCSFLIVGGVSACGKSSVGRDVALKLQYTFYDADDFHSRRSRDKMAQGIGLTDEDRDPWLQSLVELGSKHQNVVLACSALKRKYRDRLKLAVPNTIIVMISVTKPELIKRIQTRSGHYAKDTLLDSQLATLEPVGDDEERVVEVDGMQTLQEVSNQILQLMHRDL